MTRRPAALIQFGVVLLCGLWLCNCRSKNLGIPEHQLLVKTVPQYHVLATPPADVFRALRQAVDNTPQASMITCDEFSGIITWLLYTSEEEQRQYAKAKRDTDALSVGTMIIPLFGPAYEKSKKKYILQGRVETAGPRLAVGTSGQELWLGAPEFVVCTVRISPDGQGSRAQIRRLWWTMGLNAGLPRGWAHESEVLVQAGLTLRVKP